MEDSAIQDSKTTEARKEQVRKAVAKHKARMDTFTRLEQVAWKERRILGEGFDPYTPAERELAESIRQRAEDLARDAKALGKQIGDRLRRDANENIGAAALVKGLEEARDSSVLLPPF